MATIYPYTKALRRGGPSVVVRPAHDRAHVASSVTSVVLSSTKDGYLGRRATYSALSTDLDHTVTDLIVVAYNLVLVVASLTENQLLKGYAYTISMRIPDRWVERREPTHKLIYVLPLVWWAASVWLSIKEPI